MCYFRLTVLVSDDNQVLYNSIKTFCNHCGILIMNTPETNQTRKEKALERLKTLSPLARQTILLAVLEQKALRACAQESQDLVQDNRLSSSFNDNSLE